MAASQNKGLLVILTISCVNGFNIDTEIPFIRTGPNNSYFGFSIAEHQITDSNNKVLENVLLVGAPKLDRPSDPDRDTGGLYKCSFNSWCTQQCNIQVQAESDDISTITGTRTDQWFGSTVRSSGKGGYVVVCAHRYTINDSGVGKCVALHKNLIVNKLVTPCKDDTLQHQGESYCQAGTSADVNLDGTVVVGGPGSGDWTGGVYTLLTRRQLGVSSIYYSSAWRKETGRKDPPVDLHSYMGYAVTSGNYGPGPRLYVGGAPHSNGTGEVVMFSQLTGGYLTYMDTRILQGAEDFSLFGFDLATLDLNNDGYDDLVVGAPLYYRKQKAGGAIYIYMGSSNGITSDTKPVMIANSKETEEECRKLNCTESRFGFAVAPAGDINLDGYQDLVVGAPYELEGSGAVYLFHGSKDGIVKKYSQRIIGKDLDPNIKAFGHAVSGQMDLDSNGYDDISVGSYQSDKVYLFRTRPIIHLSANISVSPKKLNLSRLPDCEIPGELKKHYCTTVKICLSFSAKPKESFQTGQTIFYKIEIEKDVWNKRAIFVNKDPLHPTGTIKEGRADLFMDAGDCIEEDIRLQDDFTDKLSPISFTVTYNLKKEEYPSLANCAVGIPNINKFPILLKGTDAADTTLLTEVEFTKDCGKNEICESNIVLTTDILYLNQDADGTKILRFGQDKNITIDIKLNNTGEPAYQTKIFVTVPETFQFSDLKAIYPMTNSVPNKRNTTYVHISDNADPFGNQAKTVNYRHYRLILDPKIISSEEQTFTIKVKVNTTSEEQTPGDDEHVFNFRVVNRAEVEIDGTAEPDGDVFYRGPARGESAMKKESDIGPAINHTFTVRNIGPGTIGGAIVRISWPFEIKTEYPQGKRLLYLMQRPLVMEGPAECPGYPEYVNVLRDVEPLYNIAAQGAGPGYKVVDGTRRRRRETETEMTTKKSMSELKKAERRTLSIIRLGCNSEKVNCAIMECRINNLLNGERVKILLRARLWQSTLVRDYPGADEVHISSTGEVILDKELNIEQNRTNDISYATTIANPDLEPRITEELKWWIILVAVLAGLVVLIIFILILWKCGFFKRLRPEGYEPTHKVDCQKNKYNDGMNEAAYS